MATRPSLLARLKDWGQQTAWREFDHDYTPLVRNVARKAGLTDVEADEVVQEVLISVARKISEFTHTGNRGSFRAWLYQQARWRIADQFRSRGHRRTAEFAAAEAGAPHLDELGDEVPSICPGDGEPQARDCDPEFQRVWDAEWEQHIRNAALERVKRKVSGWQYQLFDLHVLQGLSVRDAAHVAGTSLAAVYMAKSRVGRVLRQEVRILTVQ